MKQASHTKSLNAPTLRILPEVDLADPGLSERLAGKGERPARAVRRPDASGSARCVGRDRAGRDGRAHRHGGERGGGTERPPRPEPRGDPARHRGRQGHPRRPAYPGAPGPGFGPSPISMAPSTRCTSSPTTRSRRSTSSPSTWSPRCWPGCPGALRIGARTGRRDGRSDRVRDIAVVGVAPVHHRHRGAPRRVPVPTTR